MTHDSCLSLSLRHKYHSDPYFSINKIIKDVNDSLGVCIDDAICDKVDSYFDLSPGIFDFNFLKVSDVHDSVTASFDTESFTLEIKCNMLLSICDLCFIFLYGTLDHSVDSLREILCDKSLVEVFDALFNLNGSFSLIYVSLHINYIFVLKDKLGLKSLLYKYTGPTTNIFTVSSSRSGDCYEIHPAHCLVIGKSLYIKCKRQFGISNVFESEKLSYDILTLNCVLSEIEKIKCSLIQSIIQQCSKRKHKQCVTVLFSGGLDSALIARIVAEYITDVEYIELVNVAFNKTDSPDRITGILTYEKLLQLFPNLDIRLICIDVDPIEYKNMEDIIHTLSYPNETHMDINISASLYYATSLHGYLFPKDIFESQLWIDFRNDPSLSQYLNVRITISKVKDFVLNEDCEVNLSDCNDYTTLPIVSINQGLFDLINSNIKVHSYISDSTSILIGSGADELFGGYYRYISSETANKPNLFMNEIQKDIMRLWKRNLGRDDRIFANRRKNAMYPFLSDCMLKQITMLAFNTCQLVNYLSCPKWFKNLSLYKEINPDNLPDYHKFMKSNKRKVAIYINKWILRQIALDFNMQSCCLYKKRAIQFGSKSAKIFNCLSNMSNRYASKRGGQLLR